MIRILRKSEMSTSSAARYIGALAVFGIAMLSGSIRAQATNGSQAPPGLNWKWMNEVIFGSQRLASSGTPQQHTLAFQIWADTLGQSVVFGTGKRAASFVLIGSANEGGTEYVFSMFTRAGTCEDPPNGSAGADVTYARCPLRVTILAPGGQSRSQDFSGYCYLNVDSADAPRASNHTEFAFDRRSSTAYFRVIQYGKTVSACSRSIRLAAR